jgi:hypothetical protein
MIGRRREFSNELLILTQGHRGAVAEVQPPLDTVADFMALE